MTEAEDDRITLSAATVIVEARQFLAGIDRADLYAALGAAPRATDAEIRTRIEELLEIFSTYLATADHPRDTRVAPALKHLRRIAPILTNADQRLVYDFRHGYVYAEERIARSTDEDRSIEKLREIWNQLFPENIEESKRHESMVARFEEIGDRESALHNAKAALALDPFNERLRGIVAKFELAKSRQ